MTPKTYQKRIIITADHKSVLKEPRMERMSVRNSLKKRKTRTTRTARVVRRARMERKNELLPILLAWARESATSSKMLTNTTTPSKTVHAQSFDWNRYLPCTMSRKISSSVKTTQNISSNGCDHVGSVSTPVFCASEVMNSSWMATKIQFAMMNKELTRSNVSLKTILARWLSRADSASLLLLVSRSDGLLTVLFVFVLRTVMLIFCRQKS
mmetsp:Transcript_63636/g.189628  ORF Transcript_63636/g.189628 Transcript_63636/m.189628 type:complete len:211 (+) Transcript_63636:286-918(+)